MRARIIPLLLTTTLLSACNGKTGAVADSTSQSEDSSTQTQNPQPVPVFTAVEIQRSDGIKCPAENAESSILDEDQLCASVKLSYPQVSFDANPELADTLNAVILRQLVNDSESESAVPMPSPEQFADNFTAEYKKDPNPFSSWELERSISVAFSNDQLLTLLFEEYGSTGGAHPFNNQRYTVLSLSDGKPVALADMFSPGYETPLNVAGEKIFRITRELGEADSLEEQGFSFTNNVFLLNENFGVLEEGLDFIFDSYEIAPYAMGPTQFTIPYEDIQSLIIADGLLGHTIQ